MGDRAKEIPLSIAERIKGIRAILGPFSMIGGAHEYARAQWLKVYRSLRPPLDLAAIRYVQRHHVHGLDPADVVSDILASLEEFVMDGNGPSAYFEDSLIVPMLVKQVRLRLKRPSASKPAGATWLCRAGTIGTAKQARGSPRWRPRTCRIF